MEDIRSSSRNLAPVCSCPDWGKPGSQWGSLTRRGAAPEERCAHASNRCLNQTAADRPQSRVSTLERPSSRGAAGPVPERPLSRGAVVYERPSSRAGFDRPGSRIGSVGGLPQYEAPPSRRASATGVFDNRTGMIYERSGIAVEEARTPGETRRAHSAQNNPDYEQAPQLHSVCCAEWENGLGPQSEWDIDVDIRQHIQQCTCTCNHMGYGNFMDYQE
ncbi:UNVERIFIED_CONTAM: hypothetical protein PYX00_008256 [Menopon gallinae]|uniref:Uncharacterized protein n=1 Tax=Menopon gallinae TaxID=328185 RepID=A0AAW2HM22_9NEOP